MEKILRCFKFGVLVIVNILSHVVISTLRILCPSLANKVVQKAVEAIEKKSNVKASQGEEDYQNAFTWQMLKATIYVHYLKIFNTLQEGCLAPDVILYPLKDRTEQEFDEMQPVPISALQRKDVPFVLVFGSYSCPIFWGNVEIIGDLAQTYRTIVDFAIVYVKEAHPVDGWYTSNNQYKVRTPRNLEEKMHIAKHVFEKVKNIPVYVDAISDAACLAFAAYPSTFVVLKNGRIVFFDKSQFVIALNPNLLREWIEKNVDGIESSN